MKKLMVNFEIVGKIAAKSTMLCVPAPTVAITKVTTGTAEVTNE